MSTNYGKQWEQKVKEDFLKLPNSTIDRIYDQVSGYKTISNISDFIGFVGKDNTGNIFYIECKSIHKNTFPLINLT